MQKYVQGLQEKQMKKYVQKLQEKTDGEIYSKNCRKKQMQKYG